jgi:hypothetical protein
VCDRTRINPAKIRFNIAVPSDRVPPRTRPGGARRIRGGLAGRGVSVRNGGSFQGGSPVAQHFRRGRVAPGRALVRRWRRRPRSIRSRASARAARTADPAHQGGHPVWATRGNQGDRDRRHRAGPVLRDDARRHGRGGSAGGPRRPRTRPRTELGSARARPAQHRRRPEEQGGVALVLDLVLRADCLFEGFRPGVMERLGLGPTCASSGIRASSTAA